MIETNLKIQTVEMRSDPTWEITLVDDLMYTTIRVEIVGHKNSEIMEELKNGKEYVQPGKIINVSFDKDAHQRSS